MRKRNLILCAILLFLSCLNSLSFAATIRFCCRGGQQCDGCGTAEELKRIPQLIPAFHAESRTKKSLNTRSTAISIEQSDINSLIVVGKSELIYSNNAGASFSMNIGSANSSTAQTWELPMNIQTSMTQIRKRDFINLSSVAPVAAQVPGATHVYKETNTDGGEQYLNYHFFNLDGDNLEDWGQNHVKVSTNEVYEDDGESPEQYSDAPLELDDSFDSHDEVYDMDGTGIDTYNDASTVMDAFGTIATPFGTFDCLRGKITQNTTPYDAATGTALAATLTSYFVFWVTKEGFRFYAEASPTATGNITISNFTMQYFTTSTPLPIELLAFKGEATEDGNLLTWVTANEKNNAGFEIQRSTDGKNFEKIEFVKGIGTSQAEHTYTYYDKTAINNTKTAYYRLIQMDYDGSKSLSNIISITGNDFNKNIKVYPNPTNGNEITLEISAKTEGVQIINSLGQVIYNKNTAGNQILKLDIGNWANGIYYIKSKNDMLKFVKN
jgi:Secretion system C-terminal sorting domain